MLDIKNMVLQTPKLGIVIELEDLELLWGQLIKDGLR